MRLINERQTDQTSWGGHPKGLVYPERINVASNILEAALGQGANYKVVGISDTNDLGDEFPAALYSIPFGVDCKSLALIPGWNTGSLELLIILGTQSEMQFTQEMLEPYCSLASMAILTLSKVGASQNLEKRLAALQTLNTVSQAVSVETDLNVLYQVIHREVASIIGKVNFAIATYDSQLNSITVPYMFDGQTTRSVEAFPMGEGLTSILIRTKKSLLVVENTEQKTRELGAKLVGKPAKSWLGVPLLVGGEVIGAIMLQDLEQEGRFDEDDQRLLETLASQVAVAIRNARLLEATYKQAARQQQLYVITSQIRSSKDIPGILQTTASELSKVLGARRARIELGAPSSVQQESVPSESAGA
jgi:putative methionine-R-sulfoxide reductase with GAF domain